METVNMEFHAHTADHTTLSDIIRGLSIFFPIPPSLSFFPISNPIILKITVIFQNSEKSDIGFYFILLQVSLELRENLWFHLLLVISLHHQF